MQHLIGCSHSLSGPVCKRFHYQDDDASREVDIPLGHMLRVASENAHYNSRDDSEDNRGHSYRRKWRPEIMIFQAFGFDLLCTQLCHAMVQR